MNNILEDIQSLDPNNPGMWPIHFQLGLGVIVMLILIYAGWHFNLSVQRETLNAEIVKESEHKETFDVKQRRAANLNALKEQMIEMEQSFGEMLRQLPNQTEIAGLIVDVSQTGLSAGLEFDLFKPRPEVAAEFYSKLPIDISVNGTYHQFGEFISGIAQLPRIVTTHNININTLDDGKLSMSAVAITYRATGENE
jgi:type IV pilus assembly protein PilO